MPCSSPATGAYYKLCGVTRHFGSLSGGHYTAVCRDPNTNDWLEFNDSLVTLVDASAAEVGNAYLLFYEQTS